MVAAGGYILSAILLLAAIVGWAAASSLRLRVHGLSLFALALMLDQDVHRHYAQRLQEQLEEGVERGWDDETMVTLLSIYASGLAGECVNQGMPIEAVKVAAVEHRIRTEGPQPVHPKDQP